MKENDGILFQVMEKMHEKDRQSLTVLDFKVPAFVTQGHTEKRVFLFSGQ